MTIDRIDNNANYSCGKCEECKRNGWKPNCQWTTVEEQNKNRRANVMITHEGETKCLADWARHFDLSSAILWRRINVNGMTFEEAVAKKVRPKVRAVTAFGKTRRVVEWAMEFGVPAKTISDRLIRAYWHPEDAVSVPSKGVPKHPVGSPSQPYPGVHYVKGSSYRDNEFLKIQRIRSVKAFGKVQRLVDWAEEYGVSARTISTRLTEYHWHPEDAVSVPDDGIPRHPPRKAGEPCPEIMYVRGMGPNDSLPLQEVADDLPDKDESVEVADEAKEEFPF